MSEIAKSPVVTQLGASCEKKAQDCMCSDCNIYLARQAVFHDAWTSNVKCLFIKGTLKNVPSEMLEKLMEVGFEVVKRSVGDGVQYVLMLEETMFFDAPSQKLARLEEFLRRHTLDGFYLCNRAEVITLKNYLY